MLRTAVCPLHRPLRRVAAGPAEEQQREGARQGFNNCHPLGQFHRRFRNENRRISKG